MTKHFLAALLSELLQPKNRDLLNGTTINFPLVSCKSYSGLKIHMNQVIEFTISGSTHIRATPWDTPGLKH